MLKYVEQAMHVEHSRGQMAVHVVNRAGAPLNVTAEGQHLLHRRHNSAASRRLFTIAQRQGIS